MSQGLLQLEIVCALLMNNELHMCNYILMRLVRPFS